MWRDGWDMPTLGCGVWGRVYGANREPPGETNTFRQPGVLRRLLVGGPRVGFAPHPKRIC